MSQYYGDNFQGRRPPQKKKVDKWYSWPLIILMFALGVWPVGVVLLILRLVDDEQQKKNRTRSAARPAAGVEAAVESAVERAIARADANRAGSRAGAAGEAANRAAFAGSPPVYAQPVQPGKKEKKKKTKLPGKLLRVLGVCLLACGMIVSVDSAAGLIQGWDFYLESLFQGLAMVISGGLMWGRGRYLAQMTRRSQRYILAIGNVDAMPLDEIARRVNRSPSQAARELQKLIDKGYLGEDAYVDRDRGYFLRFGVTLEEEKPVEAPAPEPVPQETEEGYSGVLRKIRRANDRIADEELSQKIDRLEQISGLIFKEVEEHPDKKGRIRTFFDYYLPTTQKLLDTYAEFEETGVEGENLREAKQRIEETMDAIVEGFEHQLDQLYSSDAMDVVSDIKVMETMLHRDTASAAKDFGFAEEGKKKTPPPAKADPYAADQQQLGQM